MANPTSATHPLTPEAASYFYAVRTTRIYCRPDCRSRRPRPENVCFYSTQAEAEAAGYRPCKRCRPQGNSSETQS